MSYFTLQYCIMSCLIISTLIVSEILRKRVEKHVRHLIGGLYALPLIPLLWIEKDNEFLTQTDITFSFYLSLIGTFFLIALLLFTIIKYIKSERRLKGRGKKEGRHS